MGILPGRSTRISEARDEFIEIYNTYLEKADVYINDNNYKELLNLINYVLSNYFFYIEYFEQCILNAICKKFDLEPFQNRCFSLYERYVFERKSNILKLVQLLSESSSDYKEVIIKFSFEQKLMGEFL